VVCGSIHVEVSGLFLGVVPVCEEVVAVQFSGDIATAVWCSFARIWRRSGGCSRGEEEVVDDSDGEELFFAVVL
jgi:hypothetical protein